MRVHRAALRGRQRHHRRASRVRAPVRGARRPRAQPHRRPAPARGHRASRGAHVPGPHAQQPVRRGGCIRLAARDAVAQGALTRGEPDGHGNRVRGASRERAARAAHAGRSEARARRPRTDPVDVR